MQNDVLTNVEYAGIHCVLAINRPAPGIAVVVLSGSDVGEFGKLPMQELAKDLARYGSIELFIDARAVRAASLEVSGEWAFWMSAHRLQFQQINMLTGSRYIQLTADFVRRFGRLGDRMRIFTEAGAFDECLAASIRLARIDPSKTGVSSGRAP